MEDFAGLIELTKVPCPGIEDINIPNGHSEVDDPLVLILLALDTFHPVPEELLIDFVDLLGVSEPVIDFLDVEVGEEGIDGAHLQRRL